MACSHHQTRPPPDRHLADAQHVRLGRQSGSRVFSHLTEEGSRITSGATYTTVNATIPSRSSWPPSPPSLAYYGPVDYEIPYVGRFRTHRGTCFRSASRRGRCRPWPSSAIVVSSRFALPWPGRCLRCASRSIPERAWRKWNPTYIQRNIDAHRRRGTASDMGEGRNSTGHHRRRGRRIG